MNPPAIRYPLTVFYDASCPLCASEMRALKKRDREAHLELLDCSSPDFDESVLSGLGITRDDLLTRIHTRDAHGRWRVALDALESAYRAVGLERAADVCLGISAFARRITRGAASRRAATGQAR